MKRLLLILFSLATLPAVQAGEDRAYLGVLLDPNPLPELLTEHLGLEPGQGLRVQNLHTGSPADKTGIERNDLIIVLEQEPVLDLERFVQRVSQAGIGKDISLEIIHKGQHRQLTVALEARPENFTPKYDPEPSTSHTMHPGKVFRMGPGQDQWIEMDPAAPMDVPAPLHPFIKEIYVFTYGQGNEQYTVTIQGDPYDNGSRLTVTQGNTEYTVPLDALDELPENTRDQAQRGLKEARQKAREKSRTQAWRQHSQALQEFWQEHKPEDLEESAQQSMDQARKYLEQWYKSRGTPTPPSAESRQRIEDLEKELKELRQRLDKLEKESPSTPKERSQI